MRNRKTPNKRNVISTALEGAFFNSRHDSLNHEKKTKQKKIKSLLQQSNKKTK